jgi:hypothetical protein
VPPRPWPRPASCPPPPHPPKLGIEDVDAVVSTIGGSVADPTADSTGNINLIEAAAKKGVKKFVLVRRGLGGGVKGVCVDGRAGRRGAHMGGLS